MRDPNLGTVVAQVCEYHHNIQKGLGEIYFGFQQSFYCGNFQHCSFAADHRSNNLKSLKFS